VKAELEGAAKAGRAISTKNESYLRELEQLHAKGSELVGKILESLGEAETEVETSDGKTSGLTLLELQTQILESEQTVNG
jgi:hypothetical protein